ncbi:MAG: hypothetical protein ACYC5A_02145 [Thermoleophilia bacterium]
MELFLGNVDNRGIALDSAARRQIPNIQDNEISVTIQNQFPKTERQWGRYVRNLRHGPTSRYNCHGLTFASRRTQIFTNDAINQILQEDGYEEVRFENVIVGDVIVYYGELGDIEHSGIVISLELFEGRINVPIVCSKWGSYNEIIHKFDECPYEPNVKFYRIDIS